MISILSHYFTELLSNLQKSADSLPCNCTVCKLFQVFFDDTRNRPVDKTPVFFMDFGIS
jgi:hypothetical protein